MNFDTGVVYLIAGILWGYYALLWQVKRSLCRWKLYFCFTMNALFWPLGILWAVVRFGDNHGD